MFVASGASEGASMWLAPFPLPRVESLAPREGEKTWIEQAACWSWVGGPKICSVNQSLRKSSIQSNGVWVELSSGRSLATIAGRVKVVWDDVQSSSISHSLVIKPEECGDSVSGFSFLYTLWGSNSDQRDFSLSLSLALFSVSRSLLTQQCSFSDL